MAIFFGICKRGMGVPLTQPPSRLEWFEGNFQDYEKDKMRRLGQDSIIPHRLKYKKLTR
jgi:hypothetical protein